ncbi:YjcZ-like family protein, partial [Acinetobacter pittii]
MSEASALNLDSDVLQLLNSLPEKFVVDFANGIDVARERQRYIAGRNTFFSRMYDGFTGQGARHQAEINA